MSAMLIAGAKSKWRVAISPGRLKALLAAEAMNVSAAWRLHTDRATLYEDLIQLDKARECL